jgi:hypothetical protein
MTQTKRPTTDLAGIIQFSGLLALTGKKERYVFTAAVKRQPLGANHVKTLRADHEETGQPRFLHGAEEGPQLRGANWRSVRMPRKKSRTFSIRYS